MARRRTEAEIEEYNNDPYQGRGSDDSASVLPVNNTVYETDAEREARLKRDEADIRQHIEQNYEGDDYESNYALWQKRDLEEQKRRDEEKSGWRISTVGQTHDNGGTEIKTGSVTGMTEDEAREKGYILAKDTTIEKLFQQQVDDAWNRLQSGNTGDRKYDYRFIEGVKNKDRTTAIKDSKGNYLRYNENGDPDPNGKYYLHAVHEKRKSGAVQLVDDALGTNFESWLDEGMFEVAGGAVDSFTFGMGSSTIGGDEYASNVHDRMDSLYGGNYDEIQQGTQIVQDIVGTVITGGAWVAVVAARTAAQGIMAESRGLKYDWGKAALNIGVSIAAQGFGKIPGISGVVGNQVTMATWSPVAGGAASALSTAALHQAVNGKMDLEALAVSAGLGGLGVNHQTAAVVAQTGYALNEAYKAGELSEKQYQKAMADLERERQRADQVYRANHAESIAGAFGIVNYAPLASDSGSGGDGVNTSNATNAFLR